MEHQIMIERLREHVSDGQMREIVDMIVKQYRNYLGNMDNLNAANLFREEYASHYRQYCISWAIISAFESGSIVAGDLQVKKIEYGRGHNRPELSNNKIKIHILSSEINLNANYLQKDYECNKNNFSNEQLCCIIRYNTKRGRLNSITLCLPDETGQIIETEKLLDRNKILKYVA